MEYYNGGSIDNVIKYIDHREIWITDRVELAIRYANAQTTGEVNPVLGQELAPNGVILTVEAAPGYWTNRGDDHNTLDSSESSVQEFKIKKATIRLPEYRNVLYGSRHTGYKTAQQFIEMLEERGIEIELV